VELVPGGYRGFFDCELRIEKTERRLRLLLSFKPQSAIEAFPARKS